MLFLILSLFFHLEGHRFFLKKEIAKLISKPTWLQEFIQLTILYLK